jgi:hypothetical protein
MAETILLPTPKLREVSRRQPTRTGKSYFIRTFGCQMNEHDSERIAGQFESDGLTAAPSLEEADVVYINTCTIRENADNRMYGNLGQLKAVKDVNPDMMLLVGGCAAQKDRDIVREKAPWVDVVMGTDGSRRALGPHYRGGGRVAGDALVAAGQARTRAFGMGDDPGRVQQHLHLLHRSLGTRGGDQPTPR